MTLVISFFLVVLVGILFGFIFTTIFVGFPLRDDLRFLLENMNCDEILKNSFEFRTSIPEFVYEKGECN